MSGNEYFQLIYCSRPPHRVWRRQIKIVNGGAVVAGGEILLPEKLRELEAQGGEVFVYRGQVMIRAALGQHGCVYCSSTGLAVCGGCGRILCTLAQSNWIHCHWCDVHDSGEIVDEEFMPVSRSGYTAWRKGRKRVWANGGARELRAGAPMSHELPAATTALPVWDKAEPVEEVQRDKRTAEEKERSRKLQKWLEDKRKKS